MVKIHDNLICREGDVKNCSRGKNSCPSGQFGGWSCDGECLYNNHDDFLNGKISKEHNPQFERLLESLKGIKND